MASNLKQKAVGNIAKTLVAMCVRTTQIENVHAGTPVISKTGDYSDVKIVDGEGKEIPWNEAARITNPEMKGFIKEVINRLYTFLLQGEDPRFQSRMDYYAKATLEWDDAEIDPNLDIEKMKNFF